jgi:hypothetical protein
MVMAECKVVHQEEQEEQDGIQAGKMEVATMQITKIFT